MGPGGWVMAAVIAITAGALLVLLHAMRRSIRAERSGRRSLRREFALSFVLLGLFLSTWVAHGLTEWQVFTDEQRAQGEEPELGDFAAEFGAATLENWQSEFLQLFSFVALAALYIHKGSAESEDSDEKVEASLQRIEAHLGTLPAAPAPSGTAWRLPETPLEAAD